MKKMMKLLTVVAAAAMGLTACQSGFEENDVNGVVKGSVVVSFVSEEARTSVDTSGDTPLFSWNESEDFAVLEQTDALAEATSVAYTKVDGKANIDAEFALNAGKEEYKYVAVYPKAGFVSADNINAAVLALPSEQSAVAGSYDPNADLMVSMPVETDVQPTEAQPMRFTRLAAVVKMTVKGLPEGEVIEKVEFTANDKNLAGTINADLEDPHAFSVKAGVSTVSVTTNSASDVYFTVLPTTLEAGDAYSVVVLTDKHLYVKQSVIPAEKSLVFEAGKVSRFGVDMESVEPSEKWVLVRDASTLEAGDVVTIAAKNNNFVLGCGVSISSDKVTYPYASRTDVVKVGDYLYHPIVTNNSNYQYMVQPLVLSKRDANKAAFDFYNGVDYTDDAYTGYFSSALTDNYLQLLSYPSKNSEFEISIDGEGVATIEAKESEWGNTLLKFYNYNPKYTSYTYRRFVCIDAASMKEANHDDVCIYKWVGKKLTVPTADAVITVPAEVVVPIGGVAEAQEFEGVAFTYVGNWAIEVSSSAEWLKLNYADGVLTYTATANPGGVRYANVTITATHDGKDAQELTFEVVQKGAPTKVTVAEFLAVAKEENANPNVEYEVTGILYDKPSSSGGTTYLVDTKGNEAKFKYVYMTDGTTALSANDKINEGDVVTIVAAVSDDATGGSSSAHAICKGYYNFSATAEKDLVGYEGGSVKITLNKGGDLEPAGDISCSVVGSGAEVTHTTNAMEATLTFGANDGAPRQAVVTFTDTYASASVAVVQSADTAKGNTWELVTDASTLEAYDQVIVAAATYDVAMGKTIDSNDRRPSVDVTKLGNYYLLPTESTLTLVLANGSADGTFAFYDAVNEGYLVSSSTSSSTYKLESQAYVNADTSYAISIADGITTIGNKEGTYSSCKFGYRASTYKYFFSGTSTSQEKVCLYRLVGVKGTIPVSPAVVTIPSKSVVVPEQATTEATLIDTVEFNYVGDWNISAVAVDNWISFEFDKARNKLTYTALKNESSARETTVTITASMEGQPSKTWEFKVVQKGAPMEVSIAQFITKEPNENVEYRFTGVVTEVPSSYGNAYVIEDGDGNKANVKYLKNGDDNYVVNEEESKKIKVGDVVTVTTVVTTTKGTGGNTTYPSYLNGYYRLAATASGSVEYLGGDVTINVNVVKNGNIVAPTTISSGEVAIDGSLISAYNFTDNGDGTATAVVHFGENTTSGSRKADFTFSAGSPLAVSTTISVMQDVNPALKKGWWLVTDVNDLAAGDEIIIAATGLDYAISTETYTNTRKSKPITKEGAALVDVADNIQQYALEIDANGLFSFKGTLGSDADKYIYAASSSSNYMKVKSTLDDNGKFTIEIASDGAATVIAQGTYTRNHMQYNNKSTSLPAFYCTDGSAGAVCFYKNYK